MGCLSVVALESSGCPGLLDGASRRRKRSRAERKRGEDGGLRGSPPSEEEQEVLDRTGSSVFSHCLPAAPGFPFCSSPGPHKHLGSSSEFPFPGGISRNASIQHTVVIPRGGHGKIGKEQLLGVKPAAPGLSIWQHQPGMSDWVLVGGWATAGESCNRAGFSLEFPWIFPGFPLDFPWDSTVAQLNRQGGCVPSSRGVPAALGVSGAVGRSGLCRAAPQAPELSSPGSCEGPLSEVQPRECCS